MYKILSKLKNTENDKIIPKEELAKPKKLINSKSIINKVIKWEKSRKKNNIKKNINSAYFYIQLFIFIIMINQSMSDLGIIITAIHPQNDESYKIFNCTEFTKPDKLIINGDESADINISEEDKFIYVQPESTNREEDNIVLIWKYSDKEKEIKKYLNKTSIFNRFFDFINSISDGEPSIEEGAELNGMGLFHDCSNIKSINFNYFHTTFIKNMYQMFDSCTSLISVTGLSLENVKNMAYLFNDCYSLKNVYFATSGISRPTNMEYMFNNCKKLFSLDLSKINTVDITNMESIFYNCGNLNNLNLGSNFYLANARNMRNMFANCKSLTNLTLYTGNSAKFSLLYMNSMFYNCINLQTLNFNFYARNISNMEFMFYGCRKLISLDLSTFNTNYLTSIEAMFYGCSQLSTLNLETFNTFHINNMSSLFYGCESLTSLNLNTFQTINVEYMDYMFYNCRSLKLLFWDTDNFKTNNVIKMNSMFELCSSFASMNLNFFVTSKVNDMNSMFSGCSSLISLYINNYYFFILKLLFIICQKCSMVVGI